MKKKKILLVEDEEDIADTTRITLEAEGYEVDVAKDGLEAVEKTYQAKPDLILLDIILPEMNGYQVCRVLKNDEKYKDIPIIMLTAKTPKSDKFRGIETGADDYLTKPYDPKVLIQKVAEFLKR
jgi:DNA-binding response OmpR family regulator